MSCFIRQDQGGARRVELLIFRVGGKVEDRAGAVLPGGEKKRVVLQGKESALRRDAIGKGREIGEIRRDRIQQQVIDEGVGVAVESGGADGRLLIGDYDVHPRVQGGKTAQTPVVLIEGADGDPIVGGDRGERIPGADRMDELWKADNQSLSHRESEPERINTVICSDGINRFAGVYHMNRHLNIPPCGKPMRDKKEICAKGSRCAITAASFCERDGQAQTSGPVKLEKRPALYEKTSRHISCAAFAESSCISYIDTIT